MTFLAAILGIIVLVQFVIIYNRACEYAKQRAYYEREIGEMSRTIRSLDELGKRYHSQIPPKEKIIEVNAEKIGDA